MEERVTGDIIYILQVPARKGGELHLAREMAAFAATRDKGGSGRRRECEKEKNIPRQGKQMQDREE